jgi:hypothetical protein
MNWSPTLFFFIVVAFVIYVFASGDDKEWRLIFTQPGHRTDPRANGGWGQTGPIATVQEGQDAGSSIGSSVGSQIPIVP